MPRPVLPKNEEKVRTKHEAIDDAIERRAQLWCQRERIVAYLPRLYQQREEARKRLEDLDQLIRDEEKAVAQIDRQVA